MSIGVVPSPFHNEQCVIKNGSSSSHVSSLPNRSLTTSCTTRAGERTCLEEGFEKAAPCDGS